MAFTVNKILLCVLLASQALQEDNVTSVERTSEIYNASCFNSSDDSSEQCLPVGTESTEVVSDYNVNLTTIDVGEDNITTTPYSEEGNGTDGNSTETSSASSFPSSTQVTSPTPSAGTIKTITEPSHILRYIPEDICTCDITVDYCDINCCCDTDCSSYDRGVFDHCIRRPPPPLDKHYCYKTYFLYHNNTEFKVQHDENGLFCIVRDNLPAETLYQDKKVVHNIKEFEKVYKRHTFYPWPLKNVSRLPLPSSTSYKAGSLVWVFGNSSWYPLAFPSGVTGTFCQASQAVHFLTDRSSSCSRAKWDCGSKDVVSASYYYENISIIAAPQTLNESRINLFLEQGECLYNVCLSFHLYKCEENSTDTDECAEVDDIDAAVLDEYSNMCMNTVKRIHYLVLHNGTLGITKAEAYFWLANATSVDEPVRQTFSVSFLWEGKQRKPFRRSGNPGYIVGKPLIAGQKVLRPAQTDDETEREAMLVSEERTRWLSLATAGPGRLCLGDRLPVAFGVDVRAACSVPLQAGNFSTAAGCLQVQRKLAELLLGESLENVTDTKQFNKYVATFGDAKAEETGDWVQVLLDRLPVFVSSAKQDASALTCKSIVTSLHLDVATAKVGLSTNPQSKIVGVAYKFGPPLDLVFHCSPLPCSSVEETESQNFEIQSSVSFVDISKPPVVRFAEPPVYEIKLPHDFFYPFLSHSRGCRLCVACRGIFLLPLVFLNMFITFTEHW